MTARSMIQASHQPPQFVPASVTGQPLFSSAMLAGMSSAMERDALAYSLDAPETIVAGGAKAVVIQGVLEGVAVRTILR